LRYSEQSSLIVKSDWQIFSLVCIVVLWFGSCFSWWVYLSCYAAVMNDAYGESGVTCLFIGVNGSGHRTGQMKQSMFW